MKKLLALAFALWASCAAAQDIPNHAMPIGGGPGTIGWKTLGPCASGQVPVWLTGPTADPTCGASAVGFTIGTSTITGGVSGRVLFDNAGVAGEYPITGTAGNSVLSIGPTFTGTILAAAQLKRFDLGLYPIGSVKQVLFDKPGISRLFCNIHPQMGAFVIAVDSPWFAVSDTSGRFTLPDVPVGTYTSHAWRAGGSPLTGSLTVEPGSRLEIEWP